MTTFLSKEVQQDLNEARSKHKRKNARYRVQFDGSMYPVLKLWDTGFSLGSEAAPQMRGLVDLFEGSNHFFRCPINASDEQDGEIKFHKHKHTTQPHLRE